MSDKLFDKLFAKLHATARGLYIQPLHFAACVGMFVIGYHTKDIFAIHSHEKLAFGRGVFLCGVFQLIVQILKAKVTSKPFGVFDNKLFYLLYIRLSVNYFHGFAPLFSFNIRRRLLHFQQSGNALFLHGNAVHNVRLFHGATTVSYGDELGSVGKVAQIMSVL